MMSRPDQELEAARAEIIARLYRIFAAYPFRRQMWVCPHCVTPEEIARLGRVPLEQLSGSDLQRYAWKALTTWGEVVDFKHFLPRWLEIILRGQDDGFALEFSQLAAKLDYGQWRAWPRAEQEAVETALLLCWRLLLAQPPATLVWETAADFLRAMAQCWESPAPFLRLWEEAVGFPPLYHLALFFVGESPGLAEPVEEVWPEAWRRGQWPLLRAWLFSPSTYDRLMALSRQRRQELPAELAEALSFFLNQRRPLF
ncbi:hypothetical protein KTAU_26420 [Thermogemmatispora aurantia]|uniref:Uncharacterized protein n=1 Tax=Thermogemmatispora aurantia TaxID=2045279 RepID=A0A5J4K934_9CHLR|nr:hypothetical protein [Thermogemmatispora aurantia]GER84005.1 hypothetical protein KTAU_26420 [Thermogemmatispora aurantia]